MIPDRRKILLNALKCYDLLITVFCFLLSASIVSYPLNDVTFSQFLTMRIKVQNFVLFIVFLLVWHMVFSLFQIYRSKRLSSRREEIRDIIKATTSGTIVLLGMAMLFRIRMITPVFAGTFWAASTGITILSRLVLRYVLGLIRTYGRNLRSMVVVGTNPRAVQFAGTIESSSELGYRILGFVDNAWEGFSDFQTTAYRVIASLDDLSAFLRDHMVDEVVIALPINSQYNQASEIVSLCENQGIIVRYLSDIFNTTLSHSRSEQMEGNPVFSHYTGGNELLAAPDKTVAGFHTLDQCAPPRIAPLFFGCPPDQDHLAWTCVLCPGEGRPQ